MPILRESLILSEIAPNAAGLLPRPPRARPAGAHSGPLNAALEFIPCVDRSGLSINDQPEKP
jgi:hypothetical protein